ncbi:Sugar transporter ERD6-like 4 [Bienertia sinuspersici]
MHYIDTWPILHTRSPRWLAKMGMMEDFEVFLQVLCGFDIDISLEVNEIKVTSKLSDVPRVYALCLLHGVT